MSSEIKSNKAAAVRAHRQQNPKATPKETAQAVGCDVTYVYLVLSKDRRGGKKKVTPAEVKEVTRGQEVLRKQLAEKDSTIAMLEKIVQSLDKEKADLSHEIKCLNIVIQYLEMKIRGTSV